MEHETTFFASPFRVLHVAPKATLEKRIRANARLMEYVTADLYREDVDVKCDITALPFPDDHFDVVLCNHVLEHVIQDRKGISELLRVLSPSGWASLLVPLSNNEVTIESSGDESDEDKRSLFGQVDHVRLYGQDYLKRLQDEGFLVQYRDYGSELGDARRFYGLLNCEQLCIGFKSSKHDPDRR